MTDKKRLPSLEYTRLSENDYTRIEGKTSKKKKPRQQPKKFLPKLGYQITFFFFGKCFKKKLFFIFYLKEQSFRLIMENNFTQMAALASNF